MINVGDLYLIENGKRRKAETAKCEHCNKLFLRRVRKETDRIKVNYLSLKEEACNSRQPPLGGCNYNFSCFIVRATARTPRA